MFTHGMAVPAFRVHGGNADRGGERNRLREMGKAATAGRGGCWAASLFRHVYTWQKVYDVQFFSGPITSVGLAELFWPRAHQDMDTWYTILVCLDLGAGLERGGDFSFCTRAVHCLTTGASRRSCHGFVRLSCAHIRQYSDAQYHTRR